ncbi:hypothetical protein OROHE_008380 [Orobanche hederae]
MDLKPFKLDVDDLMHEFAESGSATLAEFKRVWLSRKFSFIFEASPSTNQGFFMQSLYAHSIDTEYVCLCVESVLLYSILQKKVTWSQLVLSRRDWVGCIACTAYTRLSRSSHLSKFICLS